MASPKKSQTVTITPGKEPLTRVVEQDGTVHEVTLDSQVLTKLFLELGVRKVDSRYAPDDDALPDGVYDVSDFLIRLASLE